MKRNGGPILQNHKQEILQDLKELIEDGKILGMNKGDLSKRIGTSRATLNSYLIEVYKTIQPEDIEHVKIKIEAIYNRMFDELEKSLKLSDMDVRERNDTLKTLNITTKNFIDILESFGRKAKVADKLDIDLNQKQLILIQNDVIDVDKKEDGQIRSAIEHKTESSLELPDRQND